MFTDPLRTLPKLYAEHGSIAAMGRGDATVVCAFGPTYNQQLLPRAQQFEVSTDRPIPLPDNTALSRLSGNLSRTNGDAHRRIRRLMMPAFSKTAMSGYHGAMTDVLTTHMSRWRPGETVDLALAMHRITLDMFSTCLFGVSPEAGHHGEEGLAQLAAVFLRGMTSPATMLLPVDLPFLPFGKHMRRCEELELRMQALVAQRRAEGLEGRKDAVSLLLRSCDEDTEGHTPLDEAEIIANMILLFLAGYETTANGLCGALMLLAQHPERQVELREQLDGRFGGGTPSVEELAELPLLGAVVNEALRMLPPVYITLVRRSTAPFRLGQWELPADAKLVLSPLITHHMPEVWADPKRFSPARFLERKPTPYEFMPFGGGSRRCIGAAFSDLEMRLGLAMLLQRFSFGLEAGQRIDLQTRAITLGAKGSVRTRLFAPIDQPRRPTSVDGDIQDWVRW